jgi:DNA damage-inducible protein 1
MLYINCKVNGHEIQAFVDSGAQSTIISRPLAEQLGLLKLLDTRFAGTAIGIGTQKILGRVHAANMEI